MARSDPLATLLYWVMVSTGGVVLAACAVLPAWVEHLAAREQLQQAELRLAALEQRSLTIDRQIDHLERDEAYLLRLERSELNPGWSPPAVEFSVPAPAGEERRATADPVENLSELIGSIVRRYPVLGFFVAERNRPAIMALAGALILAALVLLCRTPAPERTAPP